MKDHIELITDVISAIIAKGGLDAINWSEFSVVFGFNAEGNVNNAKGYAYEPDGKWHAFSPAPREVETEVNAYEKFLREDSQKSMQQLLFQFNRDSNKFHSEFEYENPMRWKITPKNLHEAITNWKPNL